MILFNADGTVWKGSSAPSGQLQYFLNNDPTDGRPCTACVAVDNQGNCTAPATTASATATT